jgi:hypothetical protein
MANHVGIPLERIAEFVDERVYGVLEVEPL